MSFFLNRGTYTHYIRVYNNRNNIIRDNKFCFILLFVGGYEDFHGILLSQWNGKRTKQKSKTEINYLQVALCFYDIGQVNAYIRFSDANRKKSQRMSSKLYGIVLFCFVYTKRIIEDENNSMILNDLRNICFLFSSQVLRKEIRLSVKI